MPAAPGTQDALALLASQHRDILAAFVDYTLAASEALSAADRHGLLARISVRVRAHAAVEEELFYPALRQAGVPGLALDAALQDHALAAEHLQALAEVQPGDDAEHQQTFDARVQALHDEVERHLADEESQLFEQARGLGLDLSALGTQMALRHGALLGTDAGVD